MHIRKITIKNYRQIGAEPLEVNLKSGLNVVVGENNIGKTTLVEAIALALSYGSFERGSVHLQPSDFHDQAECVVIQIEFSDLSHEQEAAFIQALDLSGTTPVLRFQFNFSYRNDRIFPPEITCGQKY